MNVEEYYQHALSSAASRPTLRSAAPSTVCSVL
jgi:hypothetical protein